MITRKLTESEEKECLKLYSDGWSISKLFKYFNTSQYGITKLLRENNVKIVNRQNEINFDIEKDIIPLLKQGYSLTEISKIVNNSRQTIAFNLKKHGYKVTNKWNEAKFDETVFDCIDTEEKAYWLGFLFADGYLSSPRKNGKNEYEVELCLAIVDIDHLHKFSNFLGFTKDRVRIGKSNCNGKVFYRCRCSFGNKHLWSTLNEYGCTANKSLTLKFPNVEIFVGEQETLIKHFIRGYIDGDGAISYMPYKLSNGETKYSAYTSVLGTSDFLIEMYHHLGIEHKTLKPNSNRSDCKTFVVNFYQNETQNIIKELYENASVYLERKYNRAMFFNGVCRSSEELEKLLSGEVERQTQIIYEHKNNK